VGQFIYIAPQLPHMSPQWQCHHRHRASVQPRMQLKPAATGFGLWPYSHT